MEDEPTTMVDMDKRAGSPEEGGDERAQDSPETGGQRALVIPVTPSTGRVDDRADRDDTLDISAESRNRDVDKLEY